VTPPLVFSKESWKRFQTVCEAAYPFEGCGLLIGPLDSTEKKVETVVELKNMLREQGRGRFDFTFSPQEFMEKQHEIESRSLDIIGIYHTHPDHPARPSPTDEGQPMLSGWINVIAAVHGGRFKEARAWWRDDEQQPFIETALRMPDVV